MNRRQALLGTLAVTAGSFIPIVVHADGMEVCFNLDGVTCVYSKQLAGDLLAVHGFHPADLFRQIHGTAFWIERVIDKEAVLYDSTIGQYKFKYDITIWSNNPEDQKVKLLQDFLQLRDRLVHFGGYHPNGWPPGALLGEG